MSHTKYLKDLHGTELNRILAKILGLTTAVEHGILEYYNEDGLSEGTVSDWGIQNNNVLVDLIQRYHIAIAFNEKVGWTAKMHNGGYLASSVHLSEAVAYTIIGSLHGVMLDASILEG